MSDLQQTSVVANSSSSYRVEVSGWDEKENFFVEKAMLDWSEAEGKTIGLRSTVRVESVLFVRLMRPLGGGSSFPVPYRAVRVSSDRRDARLTVTVEQLQPRMAFRESADYLFRSDAKVA